MLWRGKFPLSRRKDEVLEPVCLFIPKHLLPLSFSIPQVLVTLLPGKHPSRVPSTVQFSVIPNNTTVFWVRGTMDL